MIHLRLMMARDVPLGMRLKEQAGWNQIEADWRRCLQLQPDGCFVAEREGVAVGTVTTCIFGSIAWIAMVLVDAAVRGQGIGRTLLDHALPSWMAAASPPCVWMPRRWAGPSTSNVDSSRNTP